MKLSSIQSNQPHKRAIKVTSRWTPTPLILMEASIRFKQSVGTDLEYNSVADDRLQTGLSVLDYLLVYQTKAHHMIN